ncbi:Zinc knuckle family protein, partial [Aphelenchoides avenae]
MPRSCAFCGAKGSHWTSDCPKYVTISERYDRAMELDFSFSCLRNDHWRNNKECRVTRLCPFCKKCRHHQALCETFVTKQRAEGGQQQRRRKKKSSNRNQRGSLQTNDDRQGRPASGARQGGGDPVAPGDSAFHRTDGGPRQSRRPDKGRERMHAAAAGNEEASLQTNERPPVYNENSGGAGPLRSLQQPSGSPVTDSCAYDSVHLTQTNGQGFCPTKGDDTSLVVMHDSDAPTEPGMEQDFDSNGCPNYSGYAAVGATHAATERTHGTFLECARATVFNQRVDTFRTRIGFDQTDGTSRILASSRLVPPLEAVFIKPSDDSLLKQNRCDLAPQNIVPDILIGRDYRHLFLLEEVRTPLHNGFCLLRTTLGTVLAGHGRLKTRSSDLTCTVKESSDSTCQPSSSFSSSEQTATAVPTRSHTTTTGNTSQTGIFKDARISHGSDAAATSKHVSYETHKHRSSDPPDKNSNIGKTENIGIEKNGPRKEDDVVHAHIRTTICPSSDDEGRYQIRLPWKTSNGEPPSNQELPSHMGLARGRLGSFQRAHAHQPEFLRKYGEGFQQMEADGVIEKFNPRDKTITFLHFLAHHAVIKESSATTKMRSVFDGSAHLPGMPSINDFLHRGPVLLPTMTGILLRTRMHGIVIIADIAKAFLQVSLHPTRVTFGLKPSPFLLGAVIQFHLEQQGPLAEEIWRNCYVDNIILSDDTLDEALAKYRGTKELFASAKMNVRQFASNSKEFNQRTADLPPEDIADLDRSSAHSRKACDASQDAYGFASYIRVPLDDARTRFEVSLAFGRCKVKPISADEKMTIPRMELMAMFLGARNAIVPQGGTLRDKHHPRKTKEKFVENRLEEIRKLQDKLGFDTRYINTSHNPGDIISRGIPAAQLQSCEHWWKGIPFLRGPDSEWPLQPPALLEPPPAKDSYESLVVEQGSHSSPYEQSFFVQRPGTI